MEEEKKGEGLHEELIIVLRTGTFKLEEKEKSQVEVFLTPYSLGFSHMLCWQLWGPEPWEPVKGRAHL